MQLKINNLYGIKNKLKPIKLLPKNIIFAPNGTGKTSILKGLININSPSETENNMEGEDMIGHLKIDGLNENDIYFIDDDILNKIIINENDSDIINHFIYENDPDLSPENICRSIQNFYDSIIDFDLPNHGFDHKVKNINFSEDYNKMIEIEDYFDTETYFKGFHNNVPEKIHEIILESKELRNELLYYSGMSSIDSRMSKPKIMKKIKTYFNNLFGKIHTTKEKEKEILIIYEELLKNIDPNIEKGISSNLIRSSFYYVRNIEKSIAKIISFLNQDCFQLIIQKKEDIFKDIYIKFNENKLKFVKKHNEIIDSLNDDSVQHNFLKWKMNFKTIRKYGEKTKITFNHGYEVSDKKRLKIYASEGQKKILALLLCFIEAKKHKFIVFDDPFNSLDSDNIGIFINQIKKIEDNHTILILTHNYNFFSNLIFQDSLKINSILMDSYNDNNVLIMPLSETEVENMQIARTWLSEEMKDNPRKLLFNATVTRELLNNYFIKVNNSNNFNNKILSFKNNLDENYRHWNSENPSFQEIRKKIENSLEKAKSFIEILSPYIFIDIKDVSISEYIKNYKPKPEFTNFLDYVSNKYLLALQIRFKIEEKHKTKKPSEIKNGLDRQILEHINYILHLNNLKWDNVIETPLYKLNIYNKQIDENNNI